MSKFALLLGSLALATSIPAQAADFASPRIAALGGSGHAGPLLNDAIYLNPSFASFLPTYSLGLNYLGLKSTTQTGRNYSVSIQDGRNPLFQAGVAYTLRDDGAFLHVGASKALVRRLGLGIGGKFLFNGQGKAAGQDLVVSTTAVPFEWFQVAGIVDNVLETSESQSRGLYREYILGTKVNLERIVLLYFDPHLMPSLSSSQRYGYESGVEFVMMSDLFLRLGAFRNAKVASLSSAIGQGYGAGLGWVGPRLSLDYGLSRTLEPRMTTTHSLGIAMYF